LIVTHVGGPTVLIEVDGWRLLTDPTFDPAGGHYRFGWGTASNKLTGPAVAVADLPPIDAVLLTHDHHGDNLDTAGRALLPLAGTVITSVSGARRLRVASARGLASGDTMRLTAPARPRVAVPVHYEGWSHFKDGRDAVERALASATEDVQRRVRWLPFGAPQRLD
jgi:L-ascorbate metabolism protein UlaG (beta-lactamase superfamily)